VVLPARADLSRIPRGGGDRRRTGRRQLARQPLSALEAAIVAFRIGAAVGIQFHAEVTETQIGQWLAEDPADVSDADALRAATRERIEGWNEFGRALCRAFLDSI